MIIASRITTIYKTFTRHDRKYSFFSVSGRDEDFLYYSHLSRPNRSLMFGRDFIGQLPHLMERDDLCIECGLGLSISGGVSLDNGDLIDWHCPVEMANQLLTDLREQLGNEGQWIELFDPATLIQTKYHGIVFHS
jgi:hypothetical protein